MRVGWGFDAHAFDPTPPLLLAGIEVDSDRGVRATSDGDVIAHATADALLGAAALGDLGEFFPSSDPAWKDADSMGLLGRVVSAVAEQGFLPQHVDVTVISQEVRVAPFRAQMRQRLAETLGLAVGGVSIKASTTDGLGFVGKDEGIAAVAVAVLERVGEGDA